jgi:hypothetical protein
VGRYLAALKAGDVDATVNTFAPDGYLRAIPRRGVLTSWSTRAAAIIAFTLVQLKARLSS